jgi:hypothetical protein
VSGALHPSAFNLLCPPGSDSFHEPVIAGKDTAFRTCLRRAGRRDESVRFIETGDNENKHFCSIVLTASYWLRILSWPNEQRPCQAKGKSGKGRNRIHKAKAVEDFISAPKN